MHKNLKKGTWHGFPKEVLKIRIMCKPITRSVAKVKKEKSENYEGPRLRFQHLRSTHCPYSSTMPLMPIPWNSSSGTIGYHQWAYNDPWLQYNFLHHERVLPNHYTFDYLQVCCLSKGPKYLICHFIFLFWLYVL